MTIRLRGVSGIRGAPSVAPVVGDFQGNPNFFATSIDTSGGIYNSRKLGFSGTQTIYTPAFVHVSAKKMLASGAFKDTAGNTLSQFTVRPWEDLEFRWDFGDPDSTEIFTRPTDGATVNSNIQAGPDAVHCYRTAGSKTVTLTVRARNSDGSGFVEAQVQDTFTVVAYSALGKSIRYVDFNNGNDAWNGQAPQFVSGTTGPKKTYAAIRAYAVDNANVNGLDLRLAQGSVFEGTNDATWQWAGLPFCTNWRISDYVGASGAGAKPKIRKVATSGNKNALWNFVGRNNVCSNVVIEFDHNGQAVTDVIVAAPAGTTHCWDHYYDNTDFIVINAIAASLGSNPGVYGLAGAGGDITLDGEVCPHEGTVTNHGLWNCTSDFSGTGKCSSNQVFMGCGKFWFVYGGIWGGGAMEADDFEHQFYCNVWRHSTYKWVGFRPLGTVFSERGVAFNINWDVDIGDDLTCQYVLISETAFPGNAANTAHECSNGSGSGTVQFRNVVAEKNSYSGFTHVRIVSTLRTKSYTWRDNRAWDNTQLVFLAQQEDESGMYYCYRNKIDIRAAGTGAGIDYRLVSGVAFQHTDNIIVSRRSTGKVFYGFGWTDMAIRNPLIDRNSYSPGTSGQQLFADEESVVKTFAQLQAVPYEINSTIGVAPGWPDPVTQWSDMGPSPT